MYALAHRPSSRKNIFDRRNQREKRRYKTIRMKLSSVFTFPRFPFFLSFSLFFFTFPLASFSSRARQILTVGRWRVRVTSDPRIRFVCLNTSKYVPLSASRGKIVPSIGRPRIFIAFMRNWKKYRKYLLNGKIFIRVTPRWNYQK